MSGITDPGIYDNISDAEYQQDCCEEISLRSSTAFKLIERGSTPAHAAWECPRLNPSYERKEARHFDIGRAAHAMLFGKGAIIKPIKGYDYARNEEGGLTKTQKADMRDKAYEAGHIPLLIPEQKQVEAMSAAAKVQIQQLVDNATIEANPFGMMQSERVLVARIHGVLCRVMTDSLSIDGDCLSEYKTEGQSAAQENFMWKARKLGYIFRLAFYRRVIEELKIAYSPRIHIFVQETKPPYLLAFYRVDDELIARENENVMRALKIWRRCLERNEWPGYSPEGFDLALTEKELMQEHGPKAASPHLDSQDVADEFYSSVIVKPRI